ncbi:MAG: signal peptidase I [Bacillota bacterium]
MKKNEKSTVWMKVANIIVIIICVLVLIIAIAAITNSINGYNNLFGSTFLAVETDSMAGENEDSFEAGDMIVSKILKDSQKKELEEGDVITFWTLIQGQRSLNTHRIVEVDETDQNVFYTTQGDANIEEDPLEVAHTDVVARYQYKIKGLGNVLLFMQSRTGFLVVIVIPSVLALSYCIFLFIKNFKGYSKLKKEEEKEKYKQKVMQEMQKSEKTAKEKEKK